MEHPHRFSTPEFHLLPGLKNCLIRKSFVPNEGAITALNDDFEDLPNSYIQVSLSGRELFTISLNLEYISCFIIRCHTSHNFSRFNLVTVFLFIINLFSEWFTFYLLELFNFFLLLPFLQFLFLEQLRFLI